MEHFKDCQEYKDLIREQKDGYICSCDGADSEVCDDCPLYILNL